MTASEAAIAATYTFETISYLRRRCPGVHFVWIMGADNLLSFHRWKRWRDIANLVPIAVIDRPGSTLRRRFRVQDKFLRPIGSTSGKELV